MSRHRAARWNLLVTPVEACEAIDRLPQRLLQRVQVTKTGGRLAAPEVLIQSLQHQDAVILDVEPITRRVLDRCQRLRVISRFGAGYDAIDLDAARQRRVRVATTAGAATAAVARHALALTLALTHRITERDRELKAGLWQRRPNLSVERLTLGIAGYGRIGAAFARLARAVGFRVVVWSRHRKPNGLRCVSSLRELVQASDIISLHVTLTPETRGLIDREVLAACRGKYLVNTARGALVDEAALLQALEQGSILGYAADVFVHEPPTDASQALAAHPRVVASPHVAALDAQTAFRMTDRALRNALCALRRDHANVRAYVV